MRQLPRQTVHTPFDSGPYRISMDLVSVPEVAWFEFDNQYFVELSEKSSLLQSKYDNVFAAMPGSDAAREETLKLITTALSQYFPEWFGSDGRFLSNNLTGEVWEIQSIDPLELAGRLVQEDLCILQDSKQGPVLTAAILCFPSRWRLLEKIGKPLSAVHEPVPLYSERLAEPVNRFMQRLKPNHVTSRLNWSLLDDPARHQPNGMRRSGASTKITATNAGSHVFLRVERQTLRRLPATNAILFGIRVHVYRLDEVIARPGCAEDLVDAITALPLAIQQYKGILPFKEALLAWLKHSTENRAI